MTSKVDWVTFPGMKTQIATTTHKTVIVNYASTRVKKERVTVVKTLYIIMLRDCGVP